MDCPATASLRCPRCGRTLRDLRGYAFNARAIEAEGECFAWSTEIEGDHAFATLFTHVETAISRALVG